MSDSPTLTIRGAVTRLYFQSPTFTAGRMLPARGDTASPGEITFAGKVFVRVGECVCFAGQWVDHEQYGRQFQVTERILEDKPTEAGLAAWLAVHGDGHGIGPAKARRIAKDFGNNFSGWLRDDPEQIAITAGIPLETVHRLAESWGEQEGLNAVGMRLAIWQLTANQIRALYDKFRESVVALLEENPYLIISEVPGFGFKRADEIAKKLGTPPTHPGRIEAAVRFSLVQSEGDGSTCSRLLDLVDATTDALDGHSEVIDLIQPKIEQMAEATRVVRVESTTGPLVALPWSYRYEQAIAEFFQTASDNPHWTGTDIPGLIDRECPELDDSQKRAVATALRNRICLISGGAGSGKTTLVRSIANLYRTFGQGEDGATVLLCAPTGKAARRLEEVVQGFPASTIHRLLEYWPKHGGFQRHRDNPLRADVVIADEVSMLDTELAYRLFDAIGPETAVVLVGDHNQLPPVGPGALLRDAIKFELLPMALLNQCHRQAGPLKQNASAILLGEVASTVDWQGEGPGPWYTARQLHTADQVREYIIQMFTEILIGKLGYDPLRDTQFLTPIHKGPIGTRELNILLQRLHQKTLGVTVEPVGPDSRPGLYVGDKIIQTRNNYDLDIMNGHQGIVLDVNPLTIDFGERTVAIPRDCYGEIELAFALTPHRCQGSEYPCIVVVVHKLHRFMLHRNWLYTAVTRAKRTCIILGDPEGISGAAKRIVNNQRRTLLPVLAVPAKVSHETD